MRLSIPSLLLVMAIAPTVGGVCRAEAEVSVKKMAPTVTRISFDRKVLPKDMPKLRDGEAAICQFNFNVAVNVKYHVVDERKVDGVTEVDCKIGQADVILTLENRIFLPRSAPLRLRTHEEAHREISERIYESAEVIAKHETDRELKKTWTARGNNADEAGQRATQLAITSIGKAILARTADKSEQVNTIFDRITEHGRLDRPTIGEAIQLSFEEHEKISATQPANSSSTNRNIHNTHRHEFARIEILIELYLIRGHPCRSVFRNSTRRLIAFAVNQAFESTARIPPRGLLAAP